jgi:hypothetical protein
LYADLYFFAYMPKSDIAESYDFHSGCTNLHSH